MTVFGLVVAGLATLQAVEVWHHGSVFAGWRARVQTWPTEGAWGRLAELLLCPFCLSVWVGTVAAVVAAVPLPAGDGWWAWVGWLALGAGKAFAYGLAASRLANLTNDATHAISRTPGRDALLPPTGEGGGLPDVPNNEIKLHEAAHDDPSAAAGPGGLVGFGFVPDPDG